MSIRSELFRGVFWSAIEKYSGVIVALIVSAVLARLVGPNEFGVIAVATVIINFFTLFATMGIFPAIIQRDDLSEEDLNSIFTFTLCGGLLFAFLFFCSSWCVAKFYDNSQLVIICQLLSVVLFFASVNIVPGALMAKNKRFKEIAKRTLTIQVFTGILSIIFAFCGAGVFALLISPILTSICVFIYNIRYFPRKVVFSIDYKPLKKIFSYSLFQFLFEFTNYFSRNLDKLIIGKYMNMSALGYYDKSYRLMMLPLQNISSVINPVMQPVLSSLQNQKEELANKYNRIISFLANISFPLSVFIYFSAYELIRIVYGNDWDEAIPVFRILSISLPFQIVFSTIGAIFQTANATNYMFYVGIRNTIITVSGFLISTFLFKTIGAIAWAWVITLWINFFLSYYTLYHSVLHSSYRKMISVFRIPVCSAFVLSICLYVFELYCPLHNIIFLIISKITLSFIISIGVLSVSGMISVKRLLNQIFNK